MEDMKVMCSICASTSGLDIYDVRQLVFLFIDELSCALNLEGVEFSF